MGKKKNRKNKASNDAKVLKEVKAEPNLEPQEEVKDEPA